MYSSYEYDKTILLDSLLQEKSHHDYCIAVMNTTNLILLDSLLQEFETMGAGDAFLRIENLFSNISKTNSPTNQLTNRPTRPRV